MQHKESGQDLGLLMKLQVCLLNISVIFMLSKGLQISKNRSE
jgi:hypothetical protein